MLLNLKWESYLISSSTVKPSQLRSAVYTWSLPDIRAEQCCISTVRVDRRISWLMGAATQDWWLVTSQDLSSLAQKTVIVLIKSVCFIVSTACKFPSYHHKINKASITPSSHGAICRIFSITIDATAIRYAGWLIKLLSSLWWISSINLWGILFFENLTHYCLMKLNCIYKITMLPIWPDNYKIIKLA